MVCDNNSADHTAEIAVVAITQIFFGKHNQIPCTRIATGNNRQG